MNCFPWTLYLSLILLHQLHFIPTVDVGKEVEVGKKDEKSCCISNDNLKFNVC